MKNHALWIALALSLISVGLSAQANPPVTPQQPAAHEPAKSVSQRLSPCEPVTGSHLTRKRGPDGKCEIDPLGGRTYTEEDLKRTGQTDVGEALKRLDPGIR